MRADSLRALLAHAIDYAGLFPPANLALEPALKNYAEYIRTPDAWMLGAQAQDFTAAVARNTDNSDAFSPGHSGYEVYGRG